MEGVAENVGAKYNEIKGKLGLGTVNRTLLDSDLGYARNKLLVSHVT
jgi:hypothetical protein